MTASAPLPDTLRYGTGTPQLLPQLCTGLVYGGSPNSTEALFTDCTLPLFEKPLAHLGIRSPIIDYTIKIAIIRLFSIQSFSTP